MSTLFVVATPLGNLGDLSPRATQVLGTVPVVAAEDTRRVRGLLTQLGASPRVLSFHAHSPERRTELLLEILGEGRDVALVSDAGTPVISDPGAGLIAAAREAGNTIIPIPGPSAVATALSVAGFPADRYLFLGFLPRKGGDRDRLLRAAADSEWPTVCYEAPARLVDLLTDLSALAGDNRPAVVARELTKLHEEVRAASLGELVRHFGEHPPLGEITVVLSGTGRQPPPTYDAGLVERRAADLLASGLTRRDAVHQLVAETSLPRNEAYRIVMSLP
jgi:16S rRNA (cytidine1402-2'-O)-methyltransferase